MDLEVTDDVGVGKTTIKVIGCGGGGSNAVDRMIKVGVQGIEFIAANTDRQALDHSMAATKIPLGCRITKGLGAGGVPDIGEQAAEEDIETVKNILKGADMVFITAGMGGGTGTGAAPVIARIAKEIGCLTVAVVTRPFHFERKMKMDMANAGITKLREHVDTLITIPNQNLLKIVNQGTSAQEAFLKADEVLQMAIQGISDIITYRGTINIDFADVRTIMKGKSDAVMGIGRGKGDNRGIDAAVDAIKNPLLDGVEIDGAQALLVNVRGGREFPMLEFDEIMNFIGAKTDNDAMVIQGLTIDENLADEVFVTVIATGFKASISGQTASEQTASEQTGRGQAGQGQAGQGQAGQGQGAQGQGAQGQTGRGQVEELTESERVAEERPKDGPMPRSSEIPYDQWNKISNGRGLRTSLPPEEEEDSLSGMGKAPAGKAVDLSFPAYIRERLPRDPGKK